MAASNTDKVKKVGASTVTTLASPGKALAASSITVGSTTNYPTDTGITIAIRVVDSDGVLVPGTYTEWDATVTSGTTFSIETTPAYGSDQVYAAGSTTQVFIPVSSSAHNDFVDAFIAEHSQLDGTHKDSVIGTANIVDGSVTTAKLADASVTNAKVALAGASNKSRVATSETTTSTSYVGLTTGQTVTVDITSTGSALVYVTTYSSNSNASVSCYASFAMSGANTLASSDINGIEHQTAGANTRDRKTAVTLLTGLNAGSTTFTMQFRTGANTATFRERELVVIPL